MRSTPPPGHRRCCGASPSPSVDPGEALRAIEAVPARKRRPEVVSPRCRDLALAGTRTGAGRGLCRCGRRRCRWRGDRGLLGMTDSVVAMAVRLPVRADGPDAAPCCIRPLTGGAPSRRDQIRLMDIRLFEQLDLNVNRVGITCGDGDGCGGPSCRGATAGSSTPPVPAPAMPRSLPDRRPRSSRRDRPMTPGGCAPAVARIAEAQQLEAEIALAATTTLPLLLA